MFRRLKIPWGQPRAGSSPVPSIFLNQPLAFIIGTFLGIKISVRTHFLRTRLQQTIATTPFLFRFFLTHLFFSRGKRGRCGTREKNPPRFGIMCGVASVAVIPFLPFLFIFKTIQFNFDMRKNCVILHFYRLQKLSKYLLDEFTQEIVNLLLLSISIFLPYFIL